MNRAFLTLSILVAFSASALAQQTEQAQQALKLKLCSHLEQLLDFTSQPVVIKGAFKLPAQYQAWMDDLSKTIDELPDGKDAFPDDLNMAAAEIRALSMDYHIKDKSPYWRDILPKVKKSIDFDKYLADKHLKELIKNTPLRRWSDSTGKFGVEAKLIRLEPTEITLEKADGSQVTVPISKLSKADRAFLKKYSL